VGFWYKWQKAIIDRKVAEKQEKEEMEVIELQNLVLIFSAVCLSQNCDFVDNDGPQGVTQYYWFLSISRQK
jgi:hypothetical protein